MNFAIQLKKKKKGTIFLLIKAKCVPSLPFFFFFFSLNSVANQLRGPSILDFSLTTLSLPACFLSLSFFFFHLIF